MDDSKGTVAATGIDSEALDHSTDEHRSLQESALTEDASQNRDGAPAVTLRMSRLFPIQHVLRISTASGCPSDFTESSASPWNPVHR
jgi:hypothetical protein